MANKYNYKRDNGISYLNILPTIIALSIVPLIVRLKITAYPVENLNWLTNNPIFENLYTHYKANVIVAIAVIATIIFLYQKSAKMKELINNKSFYYLYAYMAFVLFSWIFTTDRFFSTTGFPDHHENVFVLLSYIVIFLFTALILKTEKEFKVIINFWVISIGILFIIGLTQFLGQDVLYSDLLQRLIVPKQYLDNVEFDFTYGNKRLIYQTLFHHNYVSFYTAIAFPFFLTLSILEKERLNRIIYIVICGIMIYNLLGSGSRNGLVGIVASLVIITIFVSTYFIKHWKIFVSTVVVGFAIFIIVNVTMNTLLAQKFNYLVGQLNTVENYPMNSINTTTDSIIIDHDDFYIEVQYTDKSKVPFAFYDEEGNKYDYSIIKGNHMFTNTEGEPLEKLLDVKFLFSMRQEAPVITFNFNNIEWPFTYKDNRFYYINALGNLEVLSEVQALGFEGRERLGSARGYIWSRTLPLLKKYWLFGSGPDTYAIVFPQEDRVGKYNAYNDVNMVIDKPHNILLDYAVNTGIPSLMSLLIFWGIYIAWSGRLYFKSTFETYYAKIGMASFVAVVGYLVSGLFNDTNVNITPVFWVILGIGYAANIKYSNEKKKIINSK